MYLFTSILIVSYPPHCSKNTGHCQHYREGSGRDKALQKSTIYPNLSESSDLVVEHEGNFAIAFRLGNEVSLCTSIIYTLRMHVFYCWGQH